MNLPSGGTAAWMRGPGAIPARLQNRRPADVASGRLGMRELARAEYVF